MRIAEEIVPIPAAVLLLLLRNHTRLARMHLIAKHLTQNRRINRTGMVPMNRKNTTSLQNNACPRPRLTPKANFRLKPHETMPSIAEYRLDHSTPHAPAMLSLHCGPAETIAQRNPPVLTSLWPGSRHLLVLDTMVVTSEGTEMVAVRAHRLLLECIRPVIASIPVQQTKGKPLARNLRILALDLSNVQSIPTIADP